MRLAPTDCEDLLGRAERAALATVNPARGVDVVPACFSYAARRVAIPLDRVKAKSGGVLQRVRNLDDDRRAALLCDHWDLKDWTRLWWVRASMELTAADQSAPAYEELLQLLELKYRQYEDRPFDGVLIFEVTSLTGWAASSSALPR